MNVKMNFGPGQYDILPFGAKIIMKAMETKINETAGFMTGQLMETMVALEERYKPSSEYLDNPLNKEERMIWKNFKDAKTSILNRSNHITRNI